MAAINISTSHKTRFKFTFPFLSFLGSDQRGQDVLLYAKEVSLPGPQLDSISSGNPYIPFKQPGINMTFDNIRISFAINETFTNYIFFHNWLYALKNPTSWGLDQTAKCTGALHILSNNFNPIVKFTLHDMFPVGLSNVDLSYSSTDTTDIMATATMQFNYISIEDV